MDAATFLMLTMTCAPAVHASTAQALVDVESGFNPWAIGVVGGQLLRQPRHRAEALSTARALQASGWNFSVGLGQINVRNFRRLGLTLESAFDPCINLAAMQSVLTDCFGRSRARKDSAQAALQRALSCYYSGNFSTGFLHGYVHRVVTTARTASLRSPVPTTPLKEKP
jgi:type IV secretion system protein VirB1